jgi:N-acetylglucosaminyldiphosphoundecaprenol N-acetyl-beta-D-mannosaminyltransferase
MTPDLVIDVLAAAEAQGVRLGLYGGTEATLGAFSDLLSEAYPGLTVVYAWSPPFRALSPEEDRQVAAAIAGSRVQLLLVGIGCPKQEKWMAAHVAPGPGDMPRALTCAMVGVGAAFDVFGGRTREAPHWTQGIGLEWLFRLACEPRRLWRRQLHANPRFIALFLLQLVGACARVRAGVRGAS